MKVLAISVFAALVAAGSASASPQRLSDAEYLKVSRCAGLAKTLTNASDADQYKAVIKAQRGSRLGYIVDRGEQELDKAQKEATKESRRERLTEELTGSCSAFLGGPETVAKR